MAQIKIIKDGVEGLQKQVFPVTIKEAILNADKTTLVDDLAKKADLHSPIFTGIPLAPTAVKTTNSTQIATTGHVKLVVADYATTRQLNTHATSISPHVSGDERIKWNTAHGWGNHADANYITSYIDTKYEIISEDEITAGIATTPKTISGQRVKYMLDKVTYTPGANVQISASNVISATDTKYTASTGLDLASNAFSVKYGTATGTAAQGNDTRIINGQTAFGWGNHASAGYTKADTTYTASGYGLTLTGTTFSLDTGINQNQIPILGPNGLLDTRILPALAITDTFVVNSQAEMLALTNVQRGDIAIRSDINKTFILQTDGASVLANWKEILAPTVEVLSVNSRKGHVTITGKDVGLDVHETLPIHITGDERIKWDTAHGWGDHSKQGYLKDYINTTYSEITESEIDTGATADTLRAITGRRVKYMLDKVTYTPGANVQISASNVISATDTKYTASTGLDLASNAFSVKYGTATGTAAQGNDTRIINGQTAFGWGNHASANYIKSYIDTKYTAGAGLTLTGTVFSLPVAKVSSGTYVASVVQDENGLTVTYGTPPNAIYTAGDNVTITNNVISAIDTKYTLPTRISLGIDKVNNTADIDKPMSRFQQIALDERITMVAYSSTIYPEITLPVA